MGLGFWTDELVEILTALWADGLSASQIAAQIGGDVTRNQVIGKAHRLGLTKRPSPIKRAAATGVIPLRQGSGGQVPLKPPVKVIPAPLRSPKDIGPSPAWTVPHPRAAIPVRAEAPKPMPAALAEGQGRWRPLVEAGPRDCRWPRGDLREGSLRFCCAATEPGHSYCAEHEETARGRGAASLERYDPEAKAA